MPEFIYENPLQFEKDTTSYRLLSKEYVKTEVIDGRKVLKVDPKGLELLAKEAVSDISFYLRTSHLEKLASILKDPEATDNDRFVAYIMLRKTFPGARIQGLLLYSQKRGRMYGQAPMIRNTFQGEYLKLSRIKICVTPR
jgi:hypothetical protein